MLWERRLPRNAFSAPVQLRLGRGLRVLAHARNVSQGGLFVETPGAVVASTATEVRLKVPGWPSALTGRVAWRNPGAGRRGLGGGLGIELLGLTPDDAARLDGLAGEVEAEIHPVRIWHGADNPPVAARAVVTGRGIRVVSPLPDLPPGDAVRFRFAKGSTVYRGRVIGAPRNDGEPAGAPASPSDVVGLEIEVVQEEARRDLVPAPTAISSPAFLAAASTRAAEPAPSASPAVAPAAELAGAPRRPVTAPIVAPATPLPEPPGHLALVPMPLSDASLRRARARTAERPGARWRRHGSDRYRGRLRRRTIAIGGAALALALALLAATRDGGAERAAADDLAALLAAQPGATADPPAEPATTADDLAAAEPVADDDGDVLLVAGARAVAERAMLEDPAFAEAPEPVDLAAEALAAGVPVAARRGADVEVAVPLAGALAEERHYALTAPVGLAINLPAARTDRPGIYPIDVGSVSRVWLRPQDAGVQIRIFTGEATPDYHLERSPGVLRVILRGAATP